MSLYINQSGTGIPVVVFHGWGFNHQVFLPLANQLKTEYCFYLVDLPGFGASSLMDWNCFKSLLLEQLPESFILLGWSMGGLLATRLATEESKRVIHLINVASSPCFVKKREWPGVNPAILDQFLSRLVVDPQQVLNEFLALQIKEDLVSTAIGMPMPSTEALYAGIEILKEWDLRNSLIYFNKPVSYLFGRLDAIVSSVTMKAMQKMYPQFDYILFEQAAHIPFLSHQDQFIKTLIEILNA